MGNVNESKVVLLTVRKYFRHFGRTRQIIDQLVINIWVIVPAQHYEVAFLEEHNALHRLTLMEKSSLSSQNFNQNVVKILSIHKTNLKKKGEKKKKKAKEKNVTGEGWEK